MTTRDELADVIHAATTWHEPSDPYGTIHRQDAEAAASAVLVWLREQLGRPDIIEAVTQAIFDSRGMVIETRERVFAEIIRVLSEPTETP